MTRFITVGCSTLIIAATMASAAYSAQINTNNNSSTETVQSLKDKGFKCGRVTAGFVTCTKGDVTYYCSGSVCEKIKVNSTDRRTKPVFRQETSKIAN